MNLIVAALLIAIPASTVHAQKQQPKKGFEKLWADLFHKPTPPPKRAKKRAHAKQQHEPVASPTVPPKPAPPITPMARTPPQRASNGAYIVDAQWMAYYWEQELAWAYPIPDDLDIKFIDGKYHVPPVVFRHYEDMVNAATRRRD